MMIYGAILWFAAALLTRAIGEVAGLKMALVYALTIVGTIPFVALAKPIAGLANDQLAMGITVATATALLLDGVALNGFRGLYGAHPTDAAGMIMWGAGVAIFLAMAFNRRA